MQQPFDVSPSAPHNMSGGPMTVNSGPVKDLSHEDLGSIMPGVTATGEILVRFFYSRVQINSADAAVDGNWETRLCVAKQPRSDRNTVATSFISEDEARRMFPRQFEYFSKNEDAPTTGTPLSELPGITQSQLGLMALSGLRSIEDLAGISEDEAQEIGFDAIRAHKLAKKWTSATTGSQTDINLAEIEARFDMEMKAAKKRDDAKNEELSKLRAQVAALASVSGKAQPQQAPGEAIPRDLGDGFETDFGAMPNPMAEGPNSVDLPTMPDPLADD